ncbi:MAG: condensation domain-containing protein, partial [Blastocatellia bacterium]
MGATFYRCRTATALSTVPIGKPIANTQVHILEERGLRLPVGVAGELYIGGTGLAAGYCNRFDLTAERFVPDHLGGKPGTRLYKSGDIGRYLQDGEIDFVGRKDQQIKIRGFRVEPGEIQTRLDKHHAVRASAVVPRADGAGEKRLFAYVVLDGDNDVTANDLRKHLGEELPDYMIPASFVMLDAFPLTANGKIDLAALPAPDGARPRIIGREVGPRTELEDRLSAIWSKALGIDQIGVFDNFFELGGDSIIAIQIVARAKQSGLLLTPRNLFQHPTISDLAGVVTLTAQFTSHQDVVTGTVELTPIQRWFFEQELLDTHHYNQSVLLEVASTAGAAVLDAVLRRLLSHHDALRLRFSSSGCEWRQWNTGSEQNAFYRMVDLSWLSLRERAAVMEMLADDAQGSLDLEAGPIVRAVYFWLGSGSDSRLLVVIHHLAVDGVSWRILLDDIKNGCDLAGNGELISFDAKTTSFQEWASRLKAYAQTETVRRELEYWVSELETIMVPLPADGIGKSEIGSLRVTNANTVANVQSIVVSLTAQETRSLLQDVPRAYHTQINDVLLTALAQAFCEWTGEPGLLIDLEGHGREGIIDGVDLSRTVGWFTTIFPVALSVEASDDTGEAIKRVKEKLRSVPNRGISFGLLRYLVSDEAIRDRLSKQPPPAISFNYLGQID